MMNGQIKQHYKNIARILFAVLILNWAVALAKIIFGISSRCASMTADGFHSLSDGASNIIGLVGIHFACQPKDKEHPYGHEKYETFFSLGIAVLLFFLSLNLLKDGVIRFSAPVHPSVGKLSFAVMLITLAINFWVMTYERKKGKELHSDILISDSTHTKADIFTSCSVIITLFAIKLGFPILDPIATIIIAIFIGFSAYEIVKNSSDVLCDTAVLLDLEKISSIVCAVKGVKACHKIRTRGRPDDIHIDLHVQVDADMHVNDAHQISYAIEATLKNNIPQISDVVVHIEPK